MKVVSFSLLLLSLFILLSCSQSVTYDKHYTGVLKELDNTIADKETYSQIKDLRIDAIKSLLRETGSQEHKYRIYDNLYLEYFRYHLDSAMVYAKRKLALAEKTEDQNLVIKSRLDIAEAFTMAGMLIETKEILDDINIRSVDSTLLVDYHSAYHNLYREMRGICIYPPLESIYYEKGEEYRQKVYNLLRGDRIRELFIEASLKRKAGENKGLIDSLLPPLEEESTSFHNKAGLAYVIARAYCLNNGYQHFHAIINHCRYHYLYQPETDIGSTERTKPYKRRTQKIKCGTYRHK